MSATVEDLIGWLKKQDEVSLLELLDISSEEIVDRFVDFIEDNYDKLHADWQAETNELQESEERDY
jgi:hypothetical protein